MTDSAPDSPAELLRHFGGRVCLAFANSVLWRRSAQPRELIEGYGDLVEHLARVGGLPASDPAALQARAGAAPDQAVAALQRALAVRELLFRLMSAVAAHEAPAAGALAAFNAAAAD